MLSMSSMDDNIRKERAVKALESIANSAEDIADCVRSICGELTKWLKKRGGK